MLRTPIWKLTLADKELVFGACWVAKNVVRLNHRREARPRDAIETLRWVSRGRW